MKINGIIINKLGCANQTIPLQLPHLIEYEPEFKTNYPATINVLLESPLKIMKWDITTKPIAWIPNKPEIKEVFSFLKIIFNYQQQSSPAWIYYPHGSPNRFDPFHIEVFTKEITLTENKNCSITIGQPLRSVPWLVLE
jgi:hypothetical protein